MPEYRFDVGGLRVTAARARTAQRDLATRMAAVDRELAEIRGSWRGEAARLFDHLVEDCLRSGDLLHSQLLRLSEQLEQAAARYTEVDQVMSPPAVVMPRVPNGPGGATAGTGADAAGSP